MKRRLQKQKNFIVILCVTCALVFSLLGESISVRATKLKDIQDKIDQTKDKIDQTQNRIDGINDKISGLTDEQDLVLEMIDDLNAEIVNTMTAIGIKEDEIVAKEQELTVKQKDIDATEQEYYSAKERQEKQQADMIVRVRRMYENGNTTYLNMLLGGNGLGEILNRMDFIERLYQYDKDKLKEFENTKDSVHDLWEQLEQEKAKLEQDRVSLEADKTELEGQKTGLDTMLAKKKKESDNYEAEIKKAKQEASVAKKLLQQEQKELKKLQEEAKKGQNAAANQTYKTTDYTATIDAASGSNLGKKIAKYGCQFIGNPYVLGGTDLQKGADCSGFIYRIYADFGYKISRTSYQQRSVGVAVEYKDAQPGDIICYDGHVGLYIGGGLIVHASNKKSGIKVSKATYRTILAVRRVI